MKKYLTILILFFSFTASAQIVYTPMSAGGYQMKYLKIDSGFALPFRDTTIGRGINRPGLLVVNTQDSILYIFNGKKWTPAYVDSTGVIGLIKNKVDSVTLSGNNLFYWSNGTGYGSQLNKLDSIYMSNDSVYTCIAGNCTFRYINSGIDSLAYHYYTQTQIDSINTIYGVTNNSNRIISGGIVTWSGTGLTYYVSACTYVIGGVLYNSPDTTITLTAADPTNPRIDLFAVDTLNRALEITGVAASVPLAPQVDPSSQLALTTGINLPANATTPTGTTSTAIYDENAEWTTGGTATVNFNNTANPYHGTKDALVSSYSKNSTLTFTGTTQTVNGQVLRAFINLLNSNYSFQFRFYNGTTAVSNALTLNGFGFNPTLYNTYQNVSIPLSSFTWSGNVFDKLIITMTGKGATGTYYIDYISLESGTPVVTPPTDYSNKVDSVTTVNGSIYYWIKGMSHLVGSASGGTDSASYHTLTVNSDTTGATLNRPNGTSDFIPLPFVKKTDTTVIKVHYPLWAFSSDSLGLRTDSMPKLEYAIAGRDTSTWDNQTLIDKQFLQDRISMGSGSVLSVTGNPSNLVDNTDPANPVIQQDASKLDKSDSTIANRVTANTTNITSNTANIASNTTAISGKQNTLTLTTTGSGAASLAGSTLNIPTPSIPAQFNPIAGTNITLSGTYPNITFNSSGGGGSSSGVDSTNTATTTGQTVFTFPYTLTSYTVSSQVTRNGVLINPADYTVNTGDITFTGFTCDSGDKIRFIGIK
ncbi:MAG TPA: hypothetical protein VN726_15380 [Hanamia sp.]|nr:hypothetical protein [Hanamia sp.]